MIVLLLGTTTGFAVYRYYCGERLVSVEFINEANTCCQEDSCCHTHLEYLQLKEDYVFSVGLLNFLNDFSIDVSNFQGIFLNHTDKNCTIALISRIAPIPLSSSSKHQLAKLQVYLL